MNSGYYILEDHIPVIEPDLIKWANWFQQAKRHVAKTQISPEIKVSTVFLGLDHSFGDGPPLLFETMIFGGELDNEMDRYTNWEEAEKGHKQMVEKARTKQ